MTVAAGEACVAVLDPFRGPTTGRGSLQNRSGGSISEVRIAQRPQHGIAGMYGRASIGYKADARYRGEDHFSVDMMIENNGPPSPRRVNVVVRVD